MIRSPLLAALLLVPSLGLGQIVPPTSTIWPNGLNTGHAAADGNCPALGAPTSGEWRITAPGVYSGRHHRGVVLVQAANVTVRCSLIEGSATLPAHLTNDYNGNDCPNNLRLEYVTFGSGGFPTSDQDPYVVGIADYTAIGVKIDGLPEGFRAGSNGGNCGAVLIQDSFVRATPPTVCNDWHGDGLQGYYGPHVVIRNVTLHLANTTGCGGTAAFFYPHSQGNTSVDIVRLLVKDGSFPFRLGMPGSVSKLRIVNNFWAYGPIDVKCSVISSWDASLVTINSAYQVTNTVANQPCNTEGGS